MGKSALKLVLSQLEVVDPQKGGQPAYVRSKRSVQTSAKLKAFQQCIANDLEGKTFSNRKAVRDAFTKAAEGCS